MVVVNVDKGVWCKRVHHSVQCIRVGTYGVKDGDEKEIDGCKDGAAGVLYGDLLQGEGMPSQGTVYVIMILR